MYIELITQREKKEERGKHILLLCILIKQDIHEKECIEGVKESKLL